MALIHKNQTVLVVKRMIDISHDARLPINNRDFVLNLMACHQIISGALRVRRFRARNRPGMVEILHDEGLQKLVTL